MATITKYEELKAKWAQQIDDVANQIRCTNLKYNEFSDPNSFVDGPLAGLSGLCRATVREWINTVMRNTAASYWGADVGSEYESLLRKRVLALAADAAGMKIAP